MSCDPAHPFCVSFSALVRSFSFAHQHYSLCPFPRLRETEGMKYERMNFVLSRISLICVVVAGMSEGSPSEFESM